MEFWFMNYKDILAMTVLFVLLPMWVGYLWAEFLKLREGWNRILHAWVLGFVTMLAVAQVILVPLVALEQTLTTAMILWKMALTVFSIFSFGLLLRRWKRGKLVFLTGSADAWEESHTEAGDMSRKGWVYIFGTLAAVMILLQAYIPARYEHGDDDDARFISEEVSAVEHDTMYIDDPISGSEMYWDQGEVKKDLTSPWAMYIAMCSRISGIHPAVLSHTYLPFFLILLCYAVYLLIGHVLMRGTGKDVFVFDLFVCRPSVGLYVDTHAGVDAAASHLAGQGSLRKLSDTAVFLPDVPSDAQGVSQGLAGAFVCCCDRGMSFVGNRNYDGACDSAVVWDC